MSHAQHIATALMSWLARRWHNLGDVRQHIIAKRFMLIRLTHTGTRC
jgi:hypothetical protein